MSLGEAQLKREGLIGFPLYAIANWHALSPGTNQIPGPCEIVSEI